MSTSPPAGDGGMATVLATGDPAEQAFAESALREAGIAFATQRTAIQHMLGGGQIGGVNLVTGPPEIQVAAADAERAREVIRGAREPGDPAEPAAAELVKEPESAEAVERRARAIRYARYSAVWSVLYVFGIGSILGLYFGIRSFVTSSDIPTSQKGLAAFGIVLAAIALAIRALVLLSGA